MSGFNLDEIVTKPDRVKTQEEVHYKDKEEIGVKKIEKQEIESKDKLVSKVPVEWINIVDNSSYKSFVAFAKEAMAEKLVREKMLSPDSDTALLHIRKDVLDKLR
jgi:hypothetical protein